jgi:hypothetical protein
VAEVRDMRLNDVEQLQADGCNATEVSRSRRSLGTCHVDVDPRRETVRIHLFLRRRENDVDALLFRNP